MKACAKGHPPARVRERRSIIRSTTISRPREQESSLRVASIAPRVSATALQIYVPAPARVSSSAAPLGVVRS
jgi:hypothetical protein